MKWKWDIKNFKPSESCKKRNPHLYTAAGALVELQSEVAQSRVGQALVREVPRTPSRRARLAGRSGPVLRVGIVAVHHRGPRTDSHDNLPAKFKQLSDEISRWFTIDDAESEIDWWYSQIRGPRAGTIVILEKL